jgi:ABC-type sugar transport system substrate-binding protein
MRNPLLRLLAVLLALTMIAAACGGDDEGEETDTETETETEDGEAETEDGEAETDPGAQDVGTGADLSVFEGTTVGVVSLAPGLEPVDRIQAGVVECVEANGGTIQVFDAGGGVEAVQAFESANAAGVDAIYNVANDVSGGSLDAALAAAAAEDRPVVTAWGGQRAGTVAITGLEFQSAARVGQYLLDRLAAENDGVAAGKVLVANARVTPSLRQRADAFVAMVGPDTEFPEVEVIEVEVDIANALADAQAKVEQALQADPDIAAVFTSFDTIGQGAATAVDAAGGEQFVVSFNGDSTALDMIRAGGSFAATAANDLEGTATIACDVLATMLGGAEPAATTYWMDSPLVTAANVPAEGFAQGPGSFLLYQPGS